MPITNNRDREPVEDRPTVGGIHWKMEISLGALLQYAVMAIIAAFFFITSAAQKTDNTSDHLKQVELNQSAQRSELLAQMAANQADNKSHFDDLSRQIGGLPEQTAALHQLDVRMGRVEQADRDRDNTISQLHDLMVNDHALVVQDHATLDGITNANRQKLGYVK